MVSNNCFSPYFACVSFPFIERKPKGALPILNGAMVAS